MRIRDRFDPEGGPLRRWLWRFGDGGTDEGPVVWHVFSAEGSYTVVLSVYDELNVSRSATRLVVVPSRNVPPVAVFRDPPISGSVGALASFDGSASNDPEGSMVEARWEFGDGHSASGLQAQHYFREPGSYRVTLTVIDGEGALNSTSVTVRIAPAPRGSASPEAFAVVSLAVAALLLLAARPRRR